LAVLVTLGFSATSTERSLTLAVTVCVPAARAIHGGFAQFSAALFGHHVADSRRR
jgi:hypothetical protein